MNVGVVLQARMGSTRFPGKVLKPLAGRPMLVRTIERLGRVKSCQRFIVATSFKEADDPIAGICEENNIDCVRGSEEDVLSRYVKAIMRFDLDVVVRATADNPLVDPLIVDRMVERFLAAEPAFDYYSNGGDRGYPLGFGAEITWAKNLLLAFKESDDPVHHEHVMPFLYSGKDNFKTGFFEWNGAGRDLRLTVDTPLDYELVSWVFDSLYGENPEFTFQDVLGLLERNPAKARLNSAVKQRSLRKC